MKAYHFTNTTLRDGSPIPAIGEMLVHQGEVVLCRSGYHASLDPYDALHYAPGNLLHLVEVSGTVIQGDDKLVASERTILATVDAEELMRRFARWCASQVIHLWDAPEVVEQYLETGDERLRTAARAAAMAAAWAADMAADMADMAARAAARAAAGDAAWAADMAARAARDAAGDAAWAATGDAAAKKQREEFNRLVKEAFGDLQRARG